MVHRYGVISAFALALLHAAVPAHAQSAVFISGVGDDANDCLSPATPCRRLSRAQTVVSTGGVIHVLPGEYLAAQITKSVEIIADMGQASISNSVTSNGVLNSAILVIAGPTDVVRIRGMIIDRRGINFGSGIGFLSGGVLHVENCTIVNHAADIGIRFRPSGNSKLTVSNTTIANNASGGIEVRPGADAFATVTIDNTRLLDNNRGIEVLNRSSVMMRNSAIAGNGIGLLARNRGVLRVASSMVSGNGTGLKVLNHGELISHRGNVIADNTLDGTFTSTVNQQ
jgi:Right handed beta helix region